MGSAYGGVDTTGEPQDDAVVADLLAQFLDRALHEGGGTPLLFAATDIHNKVFQQLLALQGVVHLRVELYAPHAVVVVGEGGVLDIRRRADDMVALGNGGDGVAVAHPHL